MRKSTLVPMALTNIGVAIVTLLFFVAIPALSGCSTTGNQAQDLATQYFVIKATDRVIGDSEPRRERVREIVSEARGFIEDDAAATIARLDAEVRSEINWRGLDAADRMLIDNILLSVRERLEREVGDGLLDPDDLVRVTDVLDWIEAAADAGPH